MNWDANGDLKSHQRKGKGRKEAVVGNVWLRGKYGEPRFGGQTLRNVVETCGGCPLALEEWVHGSGVVAGVELEGASRTCVLVVWRQRDEARRQDALGSLPR